MKKSNYIDEVQHEEEPMTLHEPAGTFYATAPREGTISLHGVWLMLHALDTPSKKWLRDRLNDDVRHDEDITHTEHYQAALADVAEGRVTKWASTDEMFEKLGL